MNEKQRTMITINKISFASRKKKSASVATRKINIKQKSTQQVPGIKSVSQEKNQYATSFTNKHNLQTQQVP